METTQTNEKMNNSKVLTSITPLALDILDSISKIVYGSNTRMSDLRKVLLSQ